MLDLNISQSVGKDGRRVQERQPVTNLALLECKMLSSTRCRRARDPGGCGEAAVVGRQEIGFKLKERQVTANQAPL